jgi:ATPase family associated with various cellular activities (AAA)
MSAKPAATPAPTQTPSEHAVRAARRAGIPLLAIETSDPAQSMIDAIRSLNGLANDTSILRWDIVRGLHGLNPPGVGLANALANDPMNAADPAECLRLLSTVKRAPKDKRLMIDTRVVVDRVDRVLCFFMNAHNYLDTANVVQALWNLRDPWKAHGFTLVLLCPALKLPDSLSHDVVVVNDPLPSTTEVETIVDRITSDAGLKDIPDREKVVDTLLGVSAFAAEQVLAMSLTREGVDRDSLWTLRRKMIEQTPGLSVWHDKTSFDDLGGLANIKDFLTKILASPRNPVRTLAFVDEIEKAFAGSAGDLSGVSQDQLRVFLTEMQDHNIPGIILVGPAGTGKSAIAKAAGAVADAEVLAIDMGAMTGSLVGESQNKIRRAFQTFNAVSQGKGLVLATCNKLASLPPELRRRFTLGTFFVDLPQEDERKAIWKIWLAKYGFEANSKLPVDTDWTGAEVRACCDIAFRTSISLVEAARFVVPVAVSAADQIDALRRQADGRFISASKPGLYRHEAAHEAAEQPSGRRRVVLADGGGS